MFCRCGSSPASPASDTGWYLLFLLLAVFLSCPTHAQTVNVDWVTSVILAERRHVEPEQLARSVQHRLDTTDRYTGFEPDENLILLRVAGGTAMITLIDEPIPGGELEEVCQYAWYWKAACDTVKNHKAHLLVILMGTDLDKLGSAVLQTRIVAGVIEATGAVAAYWGVNLQSRDTFLKSSVGVSRTRIPAMLWVNFRVSGEAGGLSMSTRGLGDFGLMEIETKDAPIPGVELLELITGMTQYLIMNGAVIEDGDTIGNTATQKICVLHAESHWNPPDKVYRVDFGR